MKKNQKTFNFSSLFPVFFLGLVAILIVINILFFNSFWLYPNLFILILLVILFFSYHFKPTKEPKEPNQMFETIIKDFPDGIIVYDPDFYVKNFNPAAEKIFQLKAEEVLAKKLEPDLLKNERFRLLIQTIFPSLAPSLKQISETNAWPQIAILNFENPPLELKTFLNRIVDKNGQVLNFIKIVHNQTREKAILRSKNEFVSVAAHQLRTPLTAIHWTFENLNNTFEKPEAKEFINEGLNASQRALKIVNDLLNVSQIEEGRFGYQFEEVDLVNFIEIVLKEALPLAKSLGIEMIFEKSNSRFKVKIDQQKLGMALANIIDNAIKYNSENGRVILSIQKMENQPFVKITVKDTGIGIDPKELKNIFQKFFRGSNISQVNPNGSGLGLYISKNIIERHGGQIGIESALNRGTTVYFTLPLDFSLIPTRETIQEEEYGWS